jgi:hypothetical protein
VNPPEQLSSISVKRENLTNPDWSYYWALYHMLAHWTGFLGVFVLLVTFAVQWNTTNTIQKPRVAYPVFATIGLVVLCGAEFYLVRCIAKESTYLLGKVPISDRAPGLIEPLHGKYLRKVTFAVILGAPLGFTLWDIAMAFGCC